MTSEQFQKLKPGDVVRNSSSREGYIVVGPTRGLLLATRVVALADPASWDKIPQAELTRRRGTSVVAEGKEEVEEETLP